MELIIVVTAVVLWLIWITVSKFQQKEIQQMQKLEAEREQLAAQRQAEFTRRQAEVAAKLRAYQEHQAQLARQQAEADARLRAEQARQAEFARQQAEAAAKLRAEQERQAELARRQAEAEAKLRAEQERARQQAELAKKLLAEEIWLFIHKGFVRYCAKASKFTPVHMSFTRFAEMHDGKPVAVFTAANNGKALEAWVAPDAHSKIPRIVHARGGIDKTADVCFVASN